MLIRSQFSNFLYSSFSLYLCTIIWALENDDDDDDDDDDYYYYSLTPSYLMSVIPLFQTPFQRLVKRMTRFHTKKTPDKTLKKLKEVLDSLKYNFAVNSQSQVDTF